MSFDAIVITIMVVLIVIYIVGLMVFWDGT